MSGGDYYLVLTAAHKVCVNDWIWDVEHDLRRVVEIRTEPERVYLRCADEAIGAWYPEAEYIAVEHLS